MLMSSIAVGCPSEQLGKILPVFEAAGIGTEVCPESALGWQLLNRVRYDATVLDCQYAHGWRQALPKMRREDFSRTSMVFAILDRDTSPTEAAQLGASVLLERDFSQDSLLQNLRAIQGTMLAQNQRYYRHSIVLPVTLVHGSLHEGECLAFSGNISRSGMRLRTKTPLPPATRLEARFHIPGPYLISAEAQVVWTDAARYSGLRFTRISHRMREQLHAWLTEEWMRSQSGLAPVPQVLPARPQEFLNRQLQCNAFIKQSPVEWRCNRCSWRYAINIEMSSPRFVLNPPDEVAAAYGHHDCLQ